MGTQELGVSMPIKVSREFILDFENMVDSCQLQGKWPFIHSFISHSTNLADSLVCKIFPLLFFFSFIEI